MRFITLTIPFLFAMATNLLAFDHSHAGWTQILKSYVNEAGLVNYAQFEKDLQSQKASNFNAYLSTLSQVTAAEFNQWPANDQKAFLINAYNALTVSLILKHFDHGKLETIKDIGSIFRSPWKLEFFGLLKLDEKKKDAYKIKTLDSIEHEHLRPTYQDYRIHAAVNCASISCPKLRNEAFVGKALDKQLDEQMVDWLKDPTRNRYDAQKGRLYLSKIFDWYGEDFKPNGGIKAVIEKYGPQEAKQALKKKGEIDYLDYNWKLNSQSTNS